MNDNPVVSVIIPFLNAEKYFEEAIESVLAQTWTDWELILVDDGSTDRSTQIAHDYKNRYDGKIVYTEHEGHLNKGISASRNLGFRTARGNYIAMLDADDAWTKHKLEQQTAILRAYPEAGMVCGNTKYWYSWTGDTNDISLDRYMHDNLSSGTPILNTLVAPPLLLVLTLNGQFDPVSMSNIMLRRETIERAGGFEDAFTGMHEDQAFLAKVYLGSPVFVSASCWDLYRQHRESCHQVAGKKGNQESAELFYLNWLEKYLGEKSIGDEGVRDALDNRLWNFRNPSLNELRYNFLQKTKDTVRTLAPKLLPRSVGEAVISKYGRRRPFGWIDFGELRKVIPVSESLGERGGNPIDGYYIDKFLGASSKYIKGITLESGNDLYAFGYGKENVIKGGIFKIPAESGPVDVELPPDIPRGGCDCIIITRTLEFMYDSSRAIETLYGVLKPGGVILAAVPGMRTPSGGKSDWYWNFTSLSARRLFEQAFPPGNVNIKCFGNPLAAVSILHGLSAEDLKPEELDYSDERYELIIGIRAFKPD